MGPAARTKLGVAATLVVVATWSVWGTATAQSPILEGDRDELAIIERACGHIAAAASDLVDLRELQQFADDTTKAQETLQEQKVLVEWPHKLVLERYTGRRRLYDLAADPDERRDLATLEPERVTAAEDILVVAPYNLQVQRLRAALPAEVQVGTVDKFQGKEAPVVVMSL